MEHKGDCFKMEGEFSGDWQEFSAVQPSYSFLMMQNGRNLLSKGPVSFCSLQMLSKLCHFKTNICRTYRIPFTQRRSRSIGRKDSKNRLARETECITSTILEGTEMEKVEVKEQKFEGKLHMYVESGKLNSHNFFPAFLRLP